MVSHAAALYCEYCYDRINTVKAIKKPQAKFPYKSMADRMQIRLDGMGEGFQIKKPSHYSQSVIKTIIENKDSLQLTGEGVLEREGVCLIPFQGFECYHSATINDNIVIHYSLLLLQNLPPNDDARM
jgi:hypothetical protein